MSTELRLRNSGLEHLFPKCFLPKNILFEECFFKKKEKEGRGEKDQMLYHPHTEIHNAHQHINSSEKCYGKEDGWTNSKQVLSTF